MVDRPRIGAYILAADPTWIRSSLARYYEHLDVLVVSAAESNRGWTGNSIRADECMSLVTSVDTRGVVRIERGQWINRKHPLDAETEQRQAALLGLKQEVDWVLQIDSDEVLPNFGALLALLLRAEDMNIDAVEWPMRVLYRHLRNGSYLEVTAKGGGARYEYPGAIAVRPNVKLVDARRAEGRFIRPLVAGDTESAQVARPAGPEEVRLPILAGSDAILHNSWARAPRAVRDKISSWGHNQGVRSHLYYYGTWLPAPLRWRHMRNFHPLFHDLWPRLDVCDIDIDAMLEPAER